MDSVSLHFSNFESKEEVAAIDTRLKELEEMPLKLQVEVVSPKIQCQNRVDIVVLTFYP